MPGRTQDRADSRQVSAGPLLSYLLDTCVVSEEIRPKPDIRVRTWLDSVNVDSLYLSVVTLTELRFGILRLPDGSKKIRLEDWFARVILNLPRERFLPVDEVVALQAASLIPQSKDRDLADIYIAATAIVRGFTVITRNIGDFQFHGLKLFNPWQR